MKHEDVILMSLPRLKNVLWHLTILFGMIKINLGDACIELVWLVKHFT